MVCVTMLLAIALFAKPRGIVEASTLQLDIEWKTYFPVGFSSSGTILTGGRRRTIFGRCEVGWDREVGWEDAAAA